MWCLGKTTRLRFWMLEAVNIVHYLFSTSCPPLFLQEAKQASRNIPPMYFTACTEKNRNAKPSCDISNPCHSTADHIFPSSFTSCTQPTCLACAGLPVASLATGIPVWKDISFKANAAPSSDTQRGFFFFSTWCANMRNGFFVFDQYFLVSGLSIILPELFALEGKSYQWPCTLLLG